LGYDLGPSVAGGRGTIVPGQTTDIGLFTGGGADGVGNFGQVGDFFGGIGDALGITDYSGTGGGLLGGLNVTGPPVENKVTSYSHATDNDREFNAFYDTKIKDPVSGKTLTPFQLNNRINSPNLGKAYADAGITSLDQILNPAPTAAAKEEKAAAPQPPPPPPLPPSLPRQPTSTGMEVRALSNGTEYYVDAAGNFAGLK